MSSAVRASVPAAEPDTPTAAAIVRAALAVMSLRGYHGTSVRDIAAEAAVSPGAIYHHFGSKHDLLAAILTRGIERLVRDTEDALLQAGENPAERLRAIIAVHVRAHTDRSMESFLGNSELRSLEPTARARVVSWRDTQQRVFDRVIADGARRDIFSTPLPTEAARSVVSACTAVASWFHHDGPLAGDEIVRRYQEIALYTVGYLGRR